MNEITKINKIVSELQSSNEDIIKEFKKIKLINQGYVLLNISKENQNKILIKLKDKEIIKIVNYLDPDEATDLLQKINQKRRTKILTQLNNNTKNKITFLLKFDPKTSAGIMSLDYIKIKSNTSFEELSKLILKHEKRTGKVPTILVVENGKLLGEIQTHTLATSRRKEKIKKYIKKVPSILYNKNQSEIISVFKKNPHNKIIVLDEDNSIIGVIYSDDILRIIQDQSTTHLTDFAGVNKEEHVFDSPITKVKNRYKWLILNLATAFLSAYIVSLFQQTISAFVLLAVYMPIVAGMGGNAGTQTLAVVIRGLTLNKIEHNSAKKVIINEVIAGFINGAINGILVTIISIIWNKNLLLGLIVGVSMIINLMIAGFFGAITPLIMKKLGKDPATSATVFITTATDVFGFLVFLGLASLLL